MEAEAEAEAMPSKRVEAEAEAEAMLFEMVEAEAEAEAVNSQICLLEAEAEAVQKSTASASLVSSRCTMNAERLKECKCLMLAKKPIVFLLSVHRCPRDCFCRNLQ